MSKRWQVPNGWLSSGAVDATVQTVSSLAPGSSPAPSSRASSPASAGSLVASSVGVSSVGSSAGSVATVSDGVAGSSAVASRSALLVSGSLPHAASVTRNTTATIPVRRVRRATLEGARWRRGAMPPHCRAHDESLPAVRVACPDIVGRHVVIREGFRVRRAASFVCAVVLASMLAACTSSDDEPTRDPVGTRNDPVKLSFMTYGPEEEVEAYEAIVKQFNE